MRVCLVLSEFFAWGKYGGFGSMARSLGNGLKQRGVEVWEIAPLRRGQRKREPIDGITVLGYPGSRVLTTEAWRVLQPGGILSIASPDYLHWKEDFYNCDYSHNNVTTVRRTLQLLHNSGFQVLKHVYLSGFFTGRPATLASYLVRWRLLFANSNRLDRKLYKLKLDFLRRFIVIGEKQT